MSGQGAKALGVYVFCCCAGWAQPPPRQSFTIGYLGAIPTGRSAWRAGSGITAAYGLRLQHHVQLDVGIEAIFRPLDPGELATRFNFHPDDRVLLIPFGGRVVADAGGGRCLLGAGLGAANMRYSTRPFAAVSLASYSGWGGYGLLNAAVYLDRKHRFRVGTTPKFYVIRSTRFRRDRWFVLPAEFGVSF